MEIKPIKCGSVFHVAYLLRPTEASLLEVTGEGFNLKCCSLPNCSKNTKLKYCVACLSFITRGIPCYVVEICILSQYCTSQYIVFVDLSTLNMLKYILLMWIVCPCTSGVSDFSYPCVF